MANTRVRKIYQFIAMSGAGKKQSAFGVFQPNGDIDVRDKAEVTISDNVTRRDEYDCDGVDLIRQPIRDRDTAISINYNEGFTPQIAARWLAYAQGVSAAPTGSTVNEVQSLTRNGTVSGGTFTISLTYEGKTGTTAAIAYDASTATILAALNKKTGAANAMGRLLKAGDVVVGGTWGTAMTLTFQGRYAGANMPAVTVNNASITGGGTIDVATDTGGNQYYHAISRSTDGSLPLFSVVTGDKNDSYDDFKYGDAVVDSINFSFEQAGGALVGMVVNILCNYTPERLTGYSAPTCVNINPLKVEDCKTSINATFETPDIASLTAFFNNNVPREAAFAYDDIDVSTAYQRGDRPAQGFSLSVYGIPSTALYTLAEAEETDGNDVAFILHLGQGGNRVSITGADTKIKFQGERLGFAGPLGQSTINIDATPLNSPPLAFAAYVGQSTAFLVSS